MKNLKEFLNKPLLKHSKAIDFLTKNNSVKTKDIPVAVSKTKEVNYSALTCKNKIKLFIPLKPTEQQLKEIPIILLHEYLHLCIDQNKNLTSIMKALIEENKSFFKKFSYAKFSSWIILHELIASSFIPEGYLGQKMGYNINYREKTRLGKTRLLIGKKMYSLAKKYIDKKIPIDKKYISKILKVLDKN